MTFADNIDPLKTYQEALLAQDGPFSVIFETEAYWDDYIVHKINSTPVLHTNPEFKAMMSIYREYFGVEPSQAEPPEASITINIMSGVLLHQTESTLTSDSSSAPNVLIPSSYHCPQPKVYARNAGQNIRLALVWWSSTSTEDVSVYYNKNGETSFPAVFF